MIGIAIGINGARALLRSLVLRMLLCMPVQQLLDVIVVPGWSWWMVMVSGLRRDGSVRVSTERSYLAIVRQEGSRMGLISIRLRKA
jgi:hypothetical protein